MGNGEVAAVIVPHVVAHNLDAHTGIPFMPHIAAHLAGALRKENFQIQVIDCFGLQPHEYELKGEFMLMGVSADWVVRHLRPDVSVIFIYCRTVEDLVSVEHLASAIHKARPNTPICFFENTQTVNSFSLKLLAENLLKNFGGTVALLGEPERRAAKVARCLIDRLDLSQISGVAFLEGDTLRVTPPPAFDN